MVNVSTFRPERGFRDELAFCSNFHPSPLTFEGIRFATVEHAFQAAKTLDRCERAIIAHAATPGRAKRLGRQVTLRPGWDAMRRDVMLDLLRSKFEHPDLADQLLATGSIELVEHNTWRDRFWGVCDGTGSNHLGRLLMQVRAELRERDAAHLSVRGSGS